MGKTRHIYTESLQHSILTYNTPFLRHSFALMIVMAQRRRCVRTRTRGAAQYAHMGLWRMWLAWLGIINCLLRFSVHHY